MFVKKGDYTIILFKMLNVGYCTYVSESNHIDLVFFTCTTELVS